MDEKTLEKMLDYGQAHGLDSMCIRLDFSLVLGPERIKIFALEAEPEVLAASFKDMAAKYNEAKAQLQKVIDELNEIETT